MSQDPLENKQCLPSLDKWKNSLSQNLFTKSGLQLHPNPMPKSPAMTNKSFPVGFILLGFSKWSFIETVLFWAVILLYTMIIITNSAIILLSCADPRLHTPMYFFLSNLSFLDLCFTTAAVPQMLSNLWGPDKSITYTGCVIQLCVLLCLGPTEDVMLVVMAFDRYVTICRPLHYNVIMHQQFCWKLVFVAWLSGLMLSVVQTPITLQLPLCAHHRLDDILCEIPAFLSLACGDTSADEWQMTISAVLFTIVPLGLILTSYVYIAQALGKIQSEEGKQKAIATCSSHLTVVVVFYGTIAMVYTDPKNDFASKNGNFFTFFYTVVTPLLNPLIYTLRNKEVKGALQRLLSKAINTGVVLKIMTFTLSPFESFELSLKRADFSSKAVISGLVFIPVILHVILLKMKSVKMPYQF